MTHSVGGAGSPSNKIWPGPRPTSVYTKWHFDPSSRLATTDMGRKLGAVPLFLGGGKKAGAGSQCGLGQGLPPYQVAS